VQGIVKVEFHNKINLADQYLFKLGCGPELKYDDGDTFIF